MFATNLGDARGSTDCSKKPTHKERTDEFFVDYADHRGRHMCTSPDLLILRL